jgi:cytochrome c553
MPGRNRRFLFLAFRVTFHRFCCQNSNMSDLILSSLGNSILGVVLFVLAAVLTFLMFYVWKFPYDHERSHSSAPRPSIITHRLLGYLFVVIYLYIMWNMVPRLWSYQIELPARTVMHLTLGILIGALLVIKIAIVRYFKHMEARLAPILGSGLFICSFLLIALVLPFSLREVYLESTALGDETMVESRIRRVRELLPSTGLKDSNLLDKLSSKKGLILGRRILTAKCVQCHDLRTVLARPRTPKAWKQTVSRMANRSTILNPITEQDQWFVTSYLIAVSPTLQETLKQRRKMEAETIKSTENMESIVKLKGIQDSKYDPIAARELFEQKCSQCHSHEQVAQSPPEDKKEVIALVQRMVGNGLTASESELNTIIQYLTLTNAKQPSQIGQKPLSEGESLDTQLAFFSQKNVEGMEAYTQRHCIDCHGSAGKHPVQFTFPVLAGQNKEYLVRQFKDIRDGTRSNSVTAIMRAIVQDVTDQEIDLIADYLSNQ